LRPYPPEPLVALHQRDRFECGEALLDDWLKDRALANQVSGASRTYVVADGSRRVHGYYALAAGAIARRAATGGVRRNMPEPVPVIVLGRLAVDKGAQGKRIGGALLRDAVERCVAVSQEIGVRALLAHALHDEARRFYEHYGFSPSPIHPMTVMLRLP